jgi:uncharacterized DUF497 family protein
MDEEFRWNDWNISHIAAHGIDIDQAEDVVLSARKPWPSYEGNGRWLVSGQDQNGLYMQVAYIIDDDGTIYVIHARPLNENEKRRFRRRRT